MTTNLSDGKANVPMRTHGHIQRSLPPNQPSELSDEQRRAGDAQGHQRQWVDHRFYKGQPGSDAW